MLGDPRRERSGEMMHAFFVEELIPSDHILRRIDAVLDTSWVRAEVASCYSERMGRRSWDPEVILRMMLLGFLYGYSEKRLCDEVRMHLGFRWFCLLHPSDPVPDRTTLVKLRNERWQAELWYRLLEKTVVACIKAGLVSGRHVAIDGTQVRANAAMGRVEAIEPPLSMREYLLRQQGWEKFIPEETPAQEKPSDDEPRPGGSADWRGEKRSNQTHRSTTDPDALLYRKSSATGAELSYLVHFCMDTKSQVTLGVQASQAHTAAEWETGERLLEGARELLGDRMKVVSADKGYGVGRFLDAVVRRGLEPHIPVQGQARERAEPVVARRRRVVSLEAARRARQRVAQVRARNRAVRAMGTRSYAISRKLRLRIEHLIGEAKDCHGLRRARYRGVDKMNHQAVMTAVVMNLKRLSRWTARRATGVLAVSARPITFLRLCRPLFAAFQPFRRTVPVTTPS
jgi:transposase